MEEIITMFLQRNFKRKCSDAIKRMMTSYYAGTKDEAAKAYLDEIFAGSADTESGRTILTEKISP